jgi:hypothetical protein
MNVQVRSLRAPSAARRRQPARLRRLTSGPADAVAAGIPRSRRGADPSEDHATYNCGCGFVFEAPVSTSVDCPHCSATQAW